MNKRNLEQTPKEFVVNNYISLRLENGKTTIYVDGEKFLHCKFVALRKKIYEIKPLLYETESIDQMAQAGVLSFALEEPEIDYISPEIEYFVHCSNLKAWEENKYNTNLLHSNLSFPLLKKLYELGDPNAKRVFKDEIARKCSQGNYNVLEYLTQEGYFDYLNKEELHALVNKKDYVEIKGKKIWIINGILHLSGLKINDISEIGRFGELNKLKVLNLGNSNFFSIPGSLTEKSSLERLNLKENQIKIVPDSIARLTKLKILNLSGNKIDTLPESIGNLTKLKELNLSDNMMQDIPKSMKNLRKLERLNLKWNCLKKDLNILTKLENLKELDVSGNVPISVEKIMRYIEDPGEKMRLLRKTGKKSIPTVIPDSIGKLKNINLLNWEINSVLKIPESIGWCSSLQILNLSRNKLWDIPTSIGKLKKLTHLYLGSNFFTEIPKFIEDCLSLQVLDLSFNKICKIPESIKGLEQLTYLNISFNNLTELPKEINNLKNLQQIDLRENPLVKKNSLKKREIMRDLRKNKINIILQN